MSIASVKIDREAVLTAGRVASMNWVSINSHSHLGWVISGVVRGVIHALGAKGVAVVVVIFSLTSMCVAVVKLAAVPGGLASVVLERIDWHAVFGHTRRAGKRQSIGSSKSVLAQSRLRKWELVYLILFARCPHNTRRGVASASSTRRPVDFVESTTMRRFALGPSNQELIIAVECMELARCVVCLQLTCTALGIRALGALLAGHLTDLVGHVERLNRELARRVRDH